MSKDVHWSKDYYQNDPTVELIGIVTALKNQQTYTNNLLEELVAKLSEIQTILMSVVADIATHK